MTGLLYDEAMHQTRGFLRYTGSTWEPVPGFESPVPIKDILIRNDTLYVCGYFYEGVGVPGTLVAMYDGENWNNLGGGLTYDQQNQSTYANAFDMLWWHDKLYVAGTFNYAGGVPAENIAQWNGHQWCGSGADMQGTDPHLLSMTTWRDTLYIAGGFDHIDGAPMSRVAKWNGGDFDAVCSPSVGLPEWKPTRTLTVQLLDAEGVWSVQTTAGQQLQVTDALGRAVVAQTQLTNTNAIVDLRGQAAGLYVVRVVDATGSSAVMKVLKP